MAATLRKKTGDLEIKLDIDFPGSLEPIPVIVKVERGTISMRLKGKRIGGHMTWGDFASHLKVDVSAPAKMMGNPLLLFEK
jgi:hypothetical protein